MILDPNFIGSAHQAAAAMRNEYTFSFYIIIVMTTVEMRSFEIFENVSCEIVADKRYILACKNKMISHEVTR